MPLNKCTYCDHDVADDATTFYHEGAPYCNETCFDEAVVELAANPPGMLSEVPLEPHMVDILLVMDGAIDIPGCIGLVPVFINEEAATTYWSGLPDRDKHSIEPREIVR